MNKKQLTTILCEQIKKIRACSLGKLINDEFSCQFNELLSTLQKRLECIIKGPGNDKTILQVKSLIEILMRIIVIIELLSGEK